MSRPPAEIGGFFASGRKPSRVGTAVKSKQLGGVARLVKLHSHGEERKATLTNCPRAGEVAR